MRHKKSFSVMIFVLKEQVEPNGNLERIRSSCSNIHENWLVNVDRGCCNAEITVRARMFFSKNFMFHVIARPDSSSEKNLGEEY